ncbi:4Fe-4S dicluster domain-containing protein [candidate division KSB1 bacterium]|jgi:hydrogenase-4 component H|nr:4Fe-4S dicluster domain-containing protein [candidate division KSB1 bacterium]
MFKSKIKEAAICFSNLRVTLPYPFGSGAEIPEGFRGKLDIDETRCIGCGGCANVCPSRLIRFYDDGERTRMEFILDRCTYCGRCEEVCPEDAIAMTIEFETSTNDKTDLYIEQDIYMATCARCGRCFETENSIDKIPTRRNRQGRNYLGACMPAGAPPLQEEVNA